MIRFNWNTKSKQVLNLYECRYRVKLRTQCWITNDKMAPAGKRSNLFLFFPAGAILSLVIENCHSYRLRTCWILCFIESGVTKSFFQNSNSNVSPNCQIDESLFISQTHDSTFPSSNRFRIFHKFFVPPNEPNPSSRVENSRATRRRSTANRSSEID